MHYRSIDIGLHSQFDIETLPEYRPDPRDDYIARGITGFIPEYINDKTSTCSVYVPALAGSTFWISYSVSPPVPAGHYFLFKMYINGAHIMTWSTGKDEGWKGKTMFGLFESPDEGDAKKRFEKRVLCFAPPNKQDKSESDAVDMFDETAHLEIRVHRANGRKRIERQAEEYEKTQHAKTGKGISLLNAGRAGPDVPKRFYKFALIDPVHQPLATFRYYYRTWSQLRDLGLMDRVLTGAGEDNDLSVIEPLDGSVRAGIRADRSRSSTSIESEDVFVDCNDGITECQGHRTTPARTRTPVETRKPSTKDPRGEFEALTKASKNRSTSLRQVSETSAQPRAYVPSGAPKTNASDEQPEETQQGNSFGTTSAQFYRLLVPPSIRLDPPGPTSRPLPTIPQKNNSSSSISYQPHPAYPDPVDEWTMRTPSPMKSVQEGMSTPLLGEYREQGRSASASASASALMNVIASAWRRRGGSQTPEGTASIDSREGTRSMP